ncbi:MAG: hypothetical protein V1811_00880 [Candidatus Micrarchaeota archaeon]
MSDEENAPISFREQRDSASQKAREISAKNRDNITKLKQLLAEAAEEKSARDVETHKVAGFKAKRSEKNGQAIALKKELSQLNEDLKKYSEAGGENPLALEAEIERQEWFLQTEVTNPRAERELSKKISELRKKLPAVKEAREILNKIRAKRSELKAVIDEGERIHAEVGKHAQLSQEHHDNLMKAQEKASKLQGFVSQALSELDEKRGEAQEAHEKLVELRKNREEEETKRVGVEEHERLQDLRKMKRDLSKQAEVIFERFKSGEKISMDEIHILRESGLV